MLVLDLVRMCREKTTDFPGSNNVNWQVDDSDLIWSNREWVGYLDLAQKEYCQRRPLRDGSSALTSVTLTGGGNGVVDLDPRILYVDRVQAAGQDFPLDKKDTLYLDQRVSGWRTKVGDPIGYVDGVTEGAILVWPVPAADLALSLDVRRLPLEPLDWDDRAAQSPEIPEVHHGYLLEWALGLARLKDDELAYNKKASDAHFALFTAQVGARPDPAQIEVQRYVANRQPRTRSYY